MEAIRQIIRTPKNHVIRVHIPPHIPENELVEIIVIVGTQQPEFERKINALKSAVQDQLFLDDLEEVSQDFAAIDAEGWEE